MKTTELSVTLCPDLRAIIDKHAQDSFLGRGERRAAFRKEVLPFVGAKHIGKAMRLYDDTPKPETMRPGDGSAAVFSIKIVLFLVWLVVALIFMGPLWTVLFAACFPVINSVASKLE